jgi:CelD/BcsL family acetyltransferase involved in cellulose biosynthesis
MTIITGHSDVTSIAAKENSSMRIEMSLAAGGRYAVSVATAPDQLQTWIPAWEELSSQVADPNVFYEPWCFLPAAKHLAPHRDWRILLIERPDSASPGGWKLSGFFPFVSGRGPARLRKLSLWQHPYCFLTNPLLERGHESNLFRTLFQSLHRPELSAGCLEFPLLAGEGPVHAALVEVTREQLCTTFKSDHYLRATTSYSGDCQERLKDAVGGHHFREYKRQRRKLEALGQLEYRFLNDIRFTDLWVDWFLELEAAGWKARAGTAMQMNPDDARFFREVVQQGMACDRVYLEGLFLDGEPIALKCNLLSPPQAFAFKIAFDETHRKFSPGQQLEFESMSHLQQRDSISTADSCAAPGHPMIDRIWKERRVIQNLLVSTGSGCSELVIGSLPLMRSLNRVRRKSLTSLLGKKN